MRYLREWLDLDLDLGIFSFTAEVPRPVTSLPPKLKTEIENRKLKIEHRKSKIQKEFSVLGFLYANHLVNN